jgi:hypothetical protein
MIVNWNAYGLEQGTTVKEDFSRLTEVFCYPKRNKEVQYEKLKAFDAIESQKRHCFSS